MIEKIGTVSIYVEDQKKSLEFWTNVVGFEVVNNQPMTPKANWIEVAPKGSPTRIVLYPRSMMGNWKELKPSILFECTNIQKSYEELKSKGVNFLGEPEKMHWGSYVKFLDLDGNEFILKGD